jgi:hypothetical protein
MKIFGLSMLHLVILIKISAIFPGQFFIPNNILDFYILPESKNFTYNFLLGFAKVS